ncbi:hypothetical protein H8356DRAFT_1345672 [Neocallimastix lanati (nom. inval.)]|nr:hypothetical protein H8356DRAFT_1345672 [Neocallimastix sp. JGI-2020a]
MEGNLVPVSVTVLVDGEEKQLNIKDIIPSLKNLEGEELDNKFSQLYDIAIVKYAEQFRNFYDENNGETYFDKDPMDTVKGNNAMTHILNPYNILEDDVDKFNELPDDIKSYWSSNIPEEFSKDEDLYKAMAIHCIKKILDVIIIFRKTEKLSFNVVSHISQD